MALYDGILVSKIDRLTRKQDWDIRQWTEEHGKEIRVVSPQLEWPPEPGEKGIATRIIWDNLVNLASGEWENTSIRYRRMQRALREQAFFVGKPPYGYRITPVDGTEHKTLTPDRVNGSIVKGMASRYLAGESLRQITEWLTASAIPAPQPPKGREGRGWTGHGQGKQCAGFCGIKPSQAGCKRTAGQCSALNRLSLLRISGAYKR